MTQIFQPPIIPKEAGVTRIPRTGLNFVAGAAVADDAVGNETEVSVSVTNYVSQTLGMSNLGNTVGTSGVVSGSVLQFILAGGNNVTLSQSLDGVSGTITISGGVAGGSNTLGMSDLGNTAGTSGVVSGSAVQFVFAGGNNITLSQSLNGVSGTITISGGAGGAAGSNTLGMSNLGNTAGTSGVVSGSAIRYLFAGGNNITLSQSLDAGNVSGTVTISAFNAPAQTVESNTFGISNLGNTSGTSGVVSGGQVRYVIQASAGLIASQSLDAANLSGSLTLLNSWSTATTVSSVATANAVGANAGRFALEGHQHGGVPTVSIVGNTAGNTTQGNLSLVLAGGPNITLSGGTAAGIMTVSVSAAAAAGGAATYSNFYEPWPFAEKATASATSTASASQLCLQPLSIPVNLSFGQVNVIRSFAFQTSAGNTFSFRLTQASNMRFVENLSITNSMIHDMFLFSRGTGGFSTELETQVSTRNSVVQHRRQTIDHSVSAAAANSTGSVSVRQTVSISLTYPTMTSGTTTSINAATTLTIWAPGTSSWSGTASNSTSQTYNTTNTASTSIASTHPAITEWSSFKVWPLAFASSVTPGEWYLGFLCMGSTSSSVSTSNTNATGTGNSYTSTWNASAMTNSGSFSWLGRTHSIASSLGWPGGNTLNYMGPSPGLGTFSGTWASNTTYLNNAGNPAGAIAYTQLRTNVSFFENWVQFASQRI